MKEVSGKCLELLSWEKFLSNLRNTPHYLSRKEYMPEVQRFADIMQLVRTMAENDMLEDYCNKNGFSAVRARQAYSEYENIVELVNQINDAYIENAIAEDKQYLDHILEDVDPAISLDEDQRRVVIADEDYTLVIAGAGAGKTTTVAAKVKYLVEKQLTKRKRKI